MAAVSNIPIHIMIRLGQPLSLIFLVLISLFACKQKEQKAITIVWTTKQATGIAVPKPLLKNLEVDSISQHLQIRLENNPTAMLGEYSIHDDHILFKPLIPLSRGLRYEVVFRNDLISSINVPLANAAEAPVLVAVFPTSDTVPANLLKFYLQFSAPMRESEALQHIALLNDNNDTLSGVFLNLQPELWNKERTVLTVWLDPGRIKRDLVPNLQMGSPLQNGQRYSLAVSNKWKDVQGLPLRQSYNRKFLAGPRDTNSPQPQRWEMNLPEAGTVQPLEVGLREPLDYFLLQETIRILDEKGKAVGGTIRITNKETSFAFHPRKQWQPGRYRIYVDSHLEDLAGNNLERLFDRDLRVATLNKIIVEKEFIIGR